MRFFLVDVGFVSSRSHLSLSLESRFWSHKCRYHHHHHHPWPLLLLLLPSFLPSTSNCSLLPVVFLFVPSPPKSVQRRSCQRLDCLELRGESHLYPFISSRMTWIFISRHLDKNSYHRGSDSRKQCSPSDVSSLRCSIFSPTTGFELRTSRRMGTS